MNARREFLAAAATGSVALTAQLSAQKPTDKTPVFWAVVELMGHVKLAGRVSETTMFGATMMRIDMPTDDGRHLVQFIDPSSGSVYRITPTTETEARKIGLQRMEPISAYESGQLGLNYEDDYQ